MYAPRLNWSCFASMWNTMHFLGAQLREWLLYSSLPVLPRMLSRSLLFIGCRSSHFTIRYYYWGSVVLCRALFPSVLLSIFQCIWYVRLCVVTTVSFSIAPTVKYQLHGVHAHACKVIDIVSFTGSNANTMKIHLLNYIVSCEWGPLWVYSCFHYEIMNHSIIKAVPW